MTGGGGLNFTKLGVRSNSSIVLVNDNLMGVKSWGQKAVNHGKQTLGRQAESKIKHICLVWYLYYDPQLYFTLQYNGCTFLFPIFPHAVNKGHG